MVDTFIGYKDNKGFYVGETAMELTYQYIFAELQKENYVFSNKEDVLFDAETAAKGRCSTWLALMWHETLTSQSDELEMIRVLETVVADLETKEEHISVEELQSFSSDAEDWNDSWSEPFKTDNVIRTINALIQMLKGEWESTNYDMKLDWG